MSENLHKILLLMLPWASVKGAVTPFHEALFTATSAVCVTGLVVQDTGSYWSSFGQAVILILIQTGGFGVVTVAAAVSMMSGRKISLMQRSTMQNAISAPKVGGIVRLTKFILKGTFLIEGMGALLLLPVFCHDFGWKGIWMAVFHSISAFCNAGFDIMGRKGHLYPSIVGYADGVIIGMIIIGAIGLLTWEDICEYKWKCKNYRMQSKLILATTVCLIIFPACFFFFADFQYLPVKSRFLASVFQSVTPRTAGFNTVDITMMTEASKVVMILLMLIGGSPGSTAGGMKTTTFAVLLLNAVATFKSQEHAGAFGRRIDDQVIKNAASIAMLYFMMFLAGGIMISTAEGLPILSSLFEAASAMGTVGLTLGITPSLHKISLYVLILLMYMGRVGGLTLIYAVFSGKNKANARHIEHNNLHNKKKTKKRAAEREQLVNYVRRELKKKVFVKPKQPAKTLVIENLGPMGGQKFGKRMNRHVSAWNRGDIITAFEELCPLYGVELVKVNPAYTSRKCSRCGHIEKANRQGDKFKCRKCGLEEHADVNAAKNILASYLSSTSIPLSASPEDVLKTEKANQI